MEIKGRVVSVLDKVTGQSAKGEWKKQQFVIETIEQYPKKICLTAWGDLTGVIEKKKPGDDVICHIDVESREYNGSWYTDVKCWKIQDAEGDGEFDPNQSDSFEGSPTPF